MTDGKAFLAANASYDSHESAKFPNVGDELEGVYRGDRKVTVMDQYKGAEVEKLVVDVETADGTFALWLESGKRLTQAIADALKESGAEWFADGGKLKVRRIDDIPPRTPGYHPAKNFIAKYTPPAPVDLANF
jgi:hypothetical protein